jgi:hypothetical protein
MTFPKPPLTYNLATDYETFIQDWFTEFPVWDNSQRWLNVDESITWAKTGGVYDSYKVNFERGYTPAGGLVQQLYVAPAQPSNIQTSAQDSLATSARLAQQAADLKAAQIQATLDREQAAKDAIQAETDATGTLSEQKSAKTFASALMQKAAPAPMGCDWVGQYARGTGISHLSVSLQSVFGNSVSGFDVSDDTIQDVKNNFQNTVNTMAATTPSVFYTNIVRNITGYGISCNTKADADAEIWKALIDLNRFPKIPYDDICASRADTIALIAERQKKGTSSAIVLDDQQAAQGNYPQSTQQTTEVIGTLPPVTTQIESEYGYEDELAKTIIPSVNVKTIQDNVAAPSFVTDYPAPATGDNFEHTAKGGGNIISPSILGSASFDVSTYVNLGLTPKDFGDYTDWNQVQSDYDSRQKNSQSFPVSTAISAWIEQKKYYDSHGITLDDLGASDWSQAKDTFLKKYNTAQIAEPIDTTVTQDNSEWWTIGGVILLVIGLAYLGKQGA